MTEPTKVTALIDEMTARGWPAPVVRSAYFRMDETGPLNITLEWPDKSCACSFVTGRGWTNIHGPLESIAVAPFTLGSITHEELLINLIAQGEPHR